MAQPFFARLRRPHSVVRALFAALALLLAAAPALAQSLVEIGADDFRISFAESAAEFRLALSAAVAYNPDRDEFLVVWHADDASLGLGDKEFEISGQRLAADGTLLGSAFRISSMGDNSTLFGAFNPAVAYDPVNEKYLVVWDADDNSGMLVNNEFEVYGRLIPGDGMGLGDPKAEQFRISVMGMDGDASPSGRFPKVAANSENGGFLVVWQGDGPHDGTLADEFEIYAQSVSGVNGALGTQLRVTSVPGDASFDARTPALAYDPVNDLFLTLWVQNNFNPMAQLESEVFGRAVSAAGPTLLGMADTRISTMGGDGDVNDAVFEPDFWRYGRATRTSRTPISAIPWTMSSKSTGSSSRRTRWVRSRSGSPTTNVFQRWARRAIRAICRRQPAFPRSWSTTRAARRS
jgi:hypothetical protein